MLKGPCDGSFFRGVRITRVIWVACGLNLRAELVSTLTRFPASEEIDSNFRSCGNFYPFAQKGNVPSFTRLRDASLSTKPR